MCRRRGSGSFRRGPDRSGRMVDGAVAASVYAVTRSVCACSATASAVCWVPVTVPGGNPVTELAVPGLSPRSPVITVGPVFEIADPARTAKLRAVPSLGWVAANVAAGQAPAITACDQDQQPDDPGTLGDTFDGHGGGRRLPDCHQRITPSNLSFCLGCVAIKAFRPG